MATMTIGAPATVVRDRTFFLTMAVVILATAAAGFGFQYAMGRSSFHSPWWVHVHAISFVSWIALYLAQNILIYRGVIRGHRTLGWVGLVLACWMVPAGVFATVMAVKLHRVPFFFADSVLLVLDPLNVLAFFVLTVAGIAMRRRTDWHRRLMLAGTINLIGPALGRLLPMPLFGVWNVWAVWAAMMFYFVVAMVYDLVARGRIHPAYYWSVGFSTLWTALVLPIAFSRPLLVLAKSLAG
jgi:hypothetical protein